MKKQNTFTISLNELKRIINESINNENNDETILDIIRSLKTYKCPKDIMQAFEVEMIMDELGDRLQIAYDKFGENIIDESMVNEGWLGGIAGYLWGAIGANLIGLPLLPWVIAVSLCTWGGHKIERYFANKHALNVLNEMQISILSALALADKKGISKEDIKNTCKRATGWNPGQTVDQINELENRGYVRISNDLVFITDEGKDFLEQAGFDKSKFENDVKTVERNIEKKSNNESINNSNDIVTEGWLGAVLGGLGMGIISLSGLLPLLIIGGGALFGHKIEDYFYNRDVLESISDEELGLLLSLEQEGSSGLSESDIMDICDATQKGSYSEKINTLKKLVEQGYVNCTGTTYYINEKGHKLLDQAGFKKEQFAQDVEKLKQQANS